MHRAAPACFQQELTLLLGREDWREVEDHLWPFVLEDPEWMGLFGAEHFGLLPIADNHDLSDAESDLLAEGRVPFEEAVQEIKTVLDALPKK